MHDGLQFNLNSYLMTAGIKFPVYFKTFSTYPTIPIFSVLLKHYGKGDL